jgi:phosphoribosylformylglycinamidine synthase subunit PurS
VGDHDENVDFDRAAEIIGDRALLEELRRLSIAVYELGAAHARAVRRRLRAHHRGAVRGVAGALRLRARVLIRPKTGILDPQGQAVERALPALGFDGVANVHVGRLIELDVEDASQVPQMCERLLANPLIEDYEVIELEDAA